MNINICKARIKVRWDMFFTQHKFKSSNINIKIHTQMWILKLKEGGYYGCPYFCSFKIYCSHSLNMFHITSEKHSCKI